MKTKKKILIIVGTRPEAIKLAPLILKLKTRSSAFDTKVCVTNQHQDLVAPIFTFFSLTADFVFDLPESSGSLFQLNINLLRQFENLDQQFQADWVIVQGDTSSAFVGGLATYYSQRKLLHIEAGLRTNNKFAPFPEELNRKMLSVLADFHAAPSKDAQQNLLVEGISAKRIMVCGNTAIDALQVALDRLKSVPKTALLQLLSDQLATVRHKKWILSTIHRRENQGPYLQGILRAMLKLSERQDVHLIHVLHPNPEIEGPVRSALGGRGNISLLSPQPYENFIWLMEQSHCILTDSGGIQEEAPSFKKPVVIVREKTERPLVVEKGAGILVGRSDERILEVVNKLLDDPIFYKALQVEENPFGDGKASDRIVDFLASETL